MVYYLYDFIPNGKEPRRIGRHGTIAIVLENANFTDAVIKESVQPQIARFKHPRRYIILEELPRNNIGKVQKNLLREQFGA